MRARAITLCGTSDSTETKIRRHTKRRSFTSFSKLPIRSKNSGGNPREPRGRQVGRKIFSRRRFAVNPKMRHFVLRMGKDVTGSHVHNSPIRVGGDQLRNFPTLFRVIDCATLVQLKVDRQRGDAKASELHCSYFHVLKSEQFGSSRIFAALETALDSPMRSVKGLYGLLLIRKNLEEV